MIEVNSKFNELEDSSAIQVCKGTHRKRIKLNNIFEELFSFSDSIPIVVDDHFKNSLNVYLVKISLFGYEGFHNGFTQFQWGFAILMIEVDDKAFKLARIAIVE